MMTILYISSEYPPETGNGGIGTYTKYIAEAMSKRGHNVYVICRNPENNYSRCIRNGVHVHRIPVSDFPLPKAKIFYIIRVLLRSFFFHTLVRLSWAISVSKEVSFIKKTTPQIDIIEYPECGAEGLLIKGSKALKVARLHTSWTDVKKIDRIKENPGDELIFPLIERSPLIKADLISSPSRAIVIKSKLTSKRGIKIIPNPIPTKQFTPTHGSGWIYTGRVERRKGVHTLIAAYSHLCDDKEIPDLTIVGAPYGIDSTNGLSYEKQIEMLINNSGYKSKITWHKGLPLDQVYELLRNSSVAFFPSLWENFPYSCLEAMASGCAVVASNCGGYPEMITHNVTGILVEPGSVDLLRNAMNALIAHPDSTRELGNAARAYVQKNFDSEIISKEMETFYLSGIESAVR